MLQIILPHNECGECPISLAWDDMTPEQRLTEFNQKCSKCLCYLHSIGVNSDSTCLGCGGYTNEGQLCSECRKKVSW